MELVKQSILKKTSALSAYFSIFVPLTIASIAVSQLRFEIILPFLLSILIMSHRVFRGPLMLGLVVLYPVLGIGRYTYDPYVICLPLWTFCLFNKAIYNPNKNDRIELGLNLIAIFTVISFVVFILLSPNSFKIFNLMFFQSKHYFALTDAFPWLLAPATIVSTLLAFKIDLGLIQRLRNNIIPSFLYVLILLLHFGVINALGAEKFYLRDYYIPVFKSTSALSIFQFAFLGFLIFDFRVTHYKKLRLLNCLSSIILLLLGLFNLFSLSSKISEQILFGQSLNRITLDPLIIFLVITLFRLKKNKHNNQDQLNKNFHPIFKPLALSFSIASLMAVLVLFSWIFIRESHWQGPQWKCLNFSLSRVLIVQEDPRFFNHIGVDFIEMDRSIKLNIAQGRIIRGASTITMQLAKLKYLYSEKTYFRKILQILMALSLEAIYSKEEILSQYIEQLEFNLPHRGAENAAKFYFNKSVETLTQLEAIKLARAAVNPFRYNPMSPLPLKLSWNDLRGKQIDDKFVRPHMNCSL